MYHQSLEEGFGLNMLHYIKQKESLTLIPVQNTLIFGSKLLIGTGNGYIDSMHFHITQSLIAILFSSDVF